jgi:hypothetical protein
MVRESVEIGFFHHPTPHVNKYKEKRSISQEIDLVSAVEGGLKNVVRVGRGFCRLKLAKVSPGSKGLPVCTTLPFFCL